MAPYSKKGVAMVTRTKRGSRPSSPTDYRVCEFCGETIHRKIMTQHLRYGCAEIARVQDSPDAPPGTVIGVGVEARKKPWTWAWLEKMYPREGWLNAMPQDNPPGGITWNGLTVQLITDPMNPGCFLVMGRNNWVFSKTIPPPHWDIYRHHLESMRSQPGALRGMLGEDVPIAYGGLEPERAVDTETGTIYTIRYDAEGKVVLR